MHKEGGIMDMDSKLNQAAKNLQATREAWGLPTGKEAGAKSWGH